MCWCRIHEQGEKKRFQLEPPPFIGSRVSGSLHNMGLQPKMLQTHGNIRLSQEVALDSHSKAIYARDNGYFKEEICPIENDIES